MNASSTRVEIKEHGIYERRDGKIAGLAQWHPEGVDAFMLECDNLSIWYDPANGGALHSHGATGADLIHEVIVGAGWRPWNGGHNPCEPGIMVEYVMRYGYIRSNPAVAGDVYWGWGGISNQCDVLAYRVAEAVVDKKATIKAVAAVAREAGIETVLIDALGDRLGAASGAPETLGDLMERASERRAADHVPWRGFLIPAAALAEIQKLEAELARVKEEWIVCKALMAQKQAFAANLHRDARRWRDFKILMDEAKSKA